MHKGQHCSEETKAKLRKAHLGMPAWNKGVPMSEEQKHKISEAKQGAHVGWHHSEATKAKLKATMNSPEVREKIASRLRGENNPFYGRHHTKDSIERANAGKREWLKDPAHRKIILENSYKGFLTLTKQLHRYIKDGLPNPAERTLQGIIEEACPKEYKYNDGWFMLAHKLPDFPNINGRKKLIELFGELYHRREEVEKRKAIFRELGWDTLIIWAKELPDRDNLISRIRQFTLEGSHV
jgi:very-short-patch-repair endonuclease